MTTSSDLQATIATPVTTTTTTPIKEPNIPSNAVIVQCNTTILSDIDTDEEDEDEEEEGIMLEINDDEDSEEDDVDDEENDSTETPDSDNSYDDMTSQDSGDLMTRLRYKSLLLSSDPLADENSILRIFGQEHNIINSFSIIDGEFQGFDDEEEDDDEEDDDQDDEDNDYTEEEGDDDDDLDYDEEQEEEGCLKRKIEEIDSDEDTLEDSEIEEGQAPPMPTMMDKLVGLSDFQSQIPIPSRIQKKLPPPPPPPQLEINCNPVAKDVSHELKSAIKTYNKPILNLFIDSSTGLLTEATRFATEINALNAVGIPLPKTIDELVSIPVNSRRRRRAKKQKKMAYVKGLKFDHTGEKEEKPKLGFYTPDEFRKYIWNLNKEEDDEEDEQEVEEAGGDSIEPKAKVVKRLRWAKELEWWFLLCPSSGVGYSVLVPFWLLIVLFGFVMLFPCTITDTLLYRPYINY